MKQFSLPNLIPEILNQDQFRFEILHPKHVELDYQAVMKSKDFLRRWSCSDWPADDFSVADNLTDLKRHYQEHQQKLAFTYTILSQDKTLCLGCIYIKPVRAIPCSTSQEMEFLEPYHFFCSYWVIYEIRNTDLDELIFFSLQKWLDTVWHFSAIFYTNNLQIPEQDVIFRNNGLELFLLLQDENRYQQCWRPIKG